MVVGRDAAMTRLCMGRCTPCTESYIVADDLLIVCKTEHAQVHQELREVQARNEGLEREVQALRVHGASHSEMQVSLETAAGAWLEAAWPRAEVHHSMMTDTETATTQAVIPGGGPGGCRHPPPFDLLRALPRPKIKPCLRALRQGQYN